MTETSAGRLFWRGQTPMSDPGRHAGVLSVLPRDPARLAAALQGLILHEHWSGAYGQTLSDERRAQVHLRGVEAMIGQILAMDPRPLDEARNLESRLIGNCRDYSLFTVAVLRAHGVPARARCGFATYFDPRRKVDHWVAERWDGGVGRWVAADSQIDTLQASHLRPDFDLLDVPGDRFITGGAAWRACRMGAEDPEAYGIMQMHGAWFIAGNLVRDAAALAGVEMLPWDSWGAMPQPEQEIARETLAWLDSLAELTADPDAHFDELIRLNRDDPRQHRPDQVFNAVRARLEAV